MRRSFFDKESVEGSKQNSYRDDKSQLSAGATHHAISVITPRIPYVNYTREHKLTWD